MANAVATPTVTYQKAGGAGYHVVGTLAIDANPAVYVTGGIVLSFLQAAIKSQRVPREVAVRGISGFVYSYVPGTNAGDGLLRIFVQDAVATNPLAQIAAAGIPAAVSGDTITFDALWDGQL